MKWNRVSEIKPGYGETVLTFHESDIYPVCAFLSGEKEGDVWRRITEGPEDIVHDGSGGYGVLYREPTHWLSLQDLCMHDLSINPETFYLR